MARRLYVDTSAYMCVLLGEAGHTSLAAELTGAELCSSVLLVLETTRNLIRLSRERILTSAELQAALARLDEDMGAFALRELTLDLCVGRTLPMVSTPRSVDLAHLRTALWFHQRSPLTRFVTVDEPQLRAAGELGLPV
jgi:hypothetical protein